MKRRDSTPLDWWALLGVSVVVFAAARVDAGPVEKRSPGKARNVIELQHWSCQNIPSWTIPGVVLSTCINFLQLIYRPNEPIHNQMSRAGIQ